MDLQDNTDQHLLFDSVILADGSRKVVPSWSPIFQWSMQSVLCARVPAVACKNATPTTTSERKPKTNRIGYSHCSEEIKSCTKISFTIQYHKRPINCGWENLFLELIEGK